MESAEVINHQVAATSLNTIEAIASDQAETSSKQRDGKIDSEGAKEQRSNGISGKIVAVVLAAGLSRRMGKAKLLLDWDGETVLARTLRNVVSADFHETLLVSGGYAEQVQGIADEAGVAWVHNPAFATGEMLSSLQAGLQAVGDDVTAVAVVLGDMPLISAELFNKLITIFNQSAKTILAPVFDGKRGHPVIFGRKHFAALLALGDGDTPRNVVQHNREALELIDVESEAVLIDLDTRESYERWRPR